MRVMRQFYLSFVRAEIDYGSFLCVSAPEKCHEALEIHKNTCIRMMFEARRTSPIHSFQAEAHLPPLSLRRYYLKVREYIKLLHRPVNNYTTYSLGINERNKESVRIPSNSFMSRVRLSCYSMEIQNIKRTETPSHRYTFMDNN